MPDFTVHQKTVHQKEETQLLPTTSTITGQRSSSSVNGKGHIFSPLNPDKGDQAHRVDQEAGPIFQSAGATSAPAEEINEKHVVSKEAPESHETVERFVTTDPSFLLIRKNEDSNAHQGKIEGKSPVKNLESVNLSIEVLSRTDDLTEEFVGYVVNMAEKYGIKVDKPAVAVEAKEVFLRKAHEKSLANFSKKFSKEDIDKIFSKEDIDKMGEEINDNIIDSGAIYEIRPDGTKGQISNDKAKAFKDDFKASFSYYLISKGLIQNTQSNQETQEKTSHPPSVSISSIPVSKIQLQLKERERSIVKDISSNISSSLEEERHRTEEAGRDRKEAEAVQASDRKKDDILAEERKQKRIKRETLEKENQDKEIKKSN